jgi:hypothetical protein
MTTLGILLREKIFSSRPKNSSNPCPTFTQGTATREIVIWTGLKTVLRHEIDQRFF